MFYSPAQRTLCPDPAWPSLTACPPTECPVQWALSALGARHRQPLAAWTLWGTSGRMWGGSCKKKERKKIFI